MGGAVCCVELRHEVRGAIGSGPAAPGREEQMSSKAEEGEKKGGILHGRGRSSQRGPGHLSSGLRTYQSAGRMYGWKSMAPPAAHHRYPKQ